MTNLTVSEFGTFYRCVNAKNESVFVTTGEKALAQSLDVDASPVRVKGYAVYPEGSRVAGDLFSDLEEAKKAARKRTFGQATNEGHPASYDPDTPTREPVNSPNPASALDDEPQNPPTAGSGMQSHFKKKAKSHKKG